MKWFYGLFRLSVLIFVLEAKFARVRSLRLLLFARTLFANMLCGLWASQTKFPAHL